MRKTAMVVVALALFLSSCAGKGGDMSAEELALQIRTEYLAAQTCRGTAKVTADYGRRVYEFTLDFLWDRGGDTVLTVVEPEELEGLSATVGQGKSRLEFQGVSLGTGDLTGEGLTPLEFLPAVMACIDGGFLAECLFETRGERETLRILCRDPEKQPGKGLESVLWFDRETHALMRCELLQNGTMILSSDFTLFTIGDTDDGTGKHEDLGRDQPG